MTHLQWIADATLLPLYWMQSLRVRRTTPRLPEPEGPREGLFGEGAPLRLLVVGDSSAAGVGVGTQADALTGQLVSRLGQRRTVGWRLVARSGLTTAEIVELVEQSNPSAFDVAVVAAGANDLTQRIPIERWIRALHRLVDVLGTRFGIAHTVLSPLPPFQEFPALPEPLRGFVGRRAAVYNAALAAFSEGRRDCTLLDSPFASGTPGLDARSAMASDGFHPGAPVYAAWAECAASEIQLLHPPSALTLGAS
ncbi:SGNH/GDSL hydrolase family protein [Myxococcus sp. K15C18031901]|uniref:SGNH/GDSL hydrolase family protein n=1 Tax=Myxococcus dinghuensis TaxID=2906761 RepID=UPI0020A73364|nr:SGNH/GDSL hydrolase family protein [Myxococcus dinghuensis]MCP3103201.1 SGNH/GDSL hydrolase family protein [Myxococcus dinghuensis]